MKREEEANKEITTEELLRNGASSVNEIAALEGFHTLNGRKNTVPADTSGATGNANGFKDFVEQAIVAAKTQKYVINSFVMIFMW